MSLPLFAGSLILLVLCFRALTRWTLNVTLALAQVLLALAFVFPLGSAIDHGLYSRLSGSARPLVPLLLAVGFAVGFEGFSGLLDRFVDGRSVKARLAPYKWASLFMAVAFLTIWLQQNFAISPARTWPVAIGVFYGTATLLRLPWFWQHPKAHLVRDRLGDRGAMALYLLLSAAAVLYGLFGHVQA